METFNNYNFSFSFRDEANEILTIADGIGLTGQKFVWIAAKNVDRKSVV